MTYFLRILLVILPSCLTVQSLANKKFIEYKLKHNKSYNSSREDVTREEIFRINSARIDEFNKQNNGYKLSVNQFADQTIQEALSKFTGLKRRSEGDLLALRSRVRKQKQRSGVSSLPNSYGYFLTEIT
jgi:hypothetical protein